MKIDIRNISQRKKGFSLSSKPEELKHIKDIRFASDVDFTMDVNQTGVNSFVLKCKVNTAQVLECSRTLKDYTRQVHLDFEIVVELNAKGQGVENIDDMDEEAYEIRVASHHTEIDISEMIRQEVLLQEPMIPVDPEAQFEEWIEAKEEEEKVDPRWAALKKLKEKE